jgi:hypothetical protein
MLAYIAIILFGLIFVLATPQSRDFVGGVLGDAGKFMQEWAPFSYLLLLLLFAAFAVGIYMVRSVPDRKEPENPMAKFRHEEPEDSE